jgi:prepilin peptidase CpaA
MTQMAALLLFPALMAFAGASDFFTMTISNRVSIGLVLGFLVMAFAIRLPFDVMALHLSCGAIVLAVTFSLFALGWIGGGDAKLSAATAVWLGWENVVDYVGMASVIGGLLTLLIIQLRRWPMPQALLARDWFARLYDHESGIPYGIALAAAGLIVYPETLVWHVATAA